MAIVAIIIVGVLAFAIAAVVIGREARRLAAQPLQPVYRLPEAVAFVAEQLDPDAASELTEADVTDVVRVHLNLLQFESTEVGDPEPEPDEQAAQSVLDVDATVQIVYRRVRANGFEVSRPHVESMMEAHMAYLRAIGAVDDVG